MNKVIKERWVTALRSGRYKQGFGAFCAPNVQDAPMYCCLGVLARILGAQPQAMINDDHRFYLDGEVFDSCDGRFPVALLRKLGLPDKMQDSLIKCNDSYCWDFEAIAEKIENEVPTNTGLKDPEKYKITSKRVKETE